MSLIDQTRELFMPILSAVLEKPRTELESVAEVFALLLSLNMLLQTPGGFDYTARECVGWLEQAGFQTMRVESLVGAEVMIVAVK